MTTNLFLLLRNFYSKVKQIISSNLYFIQADQLKRTQSSLDAIATSHASVITH